MFSTIKNLILMYFLKKFIQQFLKNFKNVKRMESIFLKESQKLT